MTAVYVVAVDPGLNCSGVAVGTLATPALPGELLHAGYVEVGGEPEESLTSRCTRMGRAIACRVIEHVPIGVGVELVVEWPRVLAATHQRAAKRGVNPSDLLPVAAVAVAVAVALADAGVEFVAVTEVHPDVWKGGQVPKDVMGQRVFARLTEVERARLAVRPLGGLDHNMLDAVGIYLHRVGRLDRKRARYR